MQDERIDILDEKGQPTGKSCPKSEIHQKGHYHQTVHVWFYTVDGEILLAQRSATKTICPLLWDVSVGGHVDSGETVETAAIRETREELGLNVAFNELKKIGVFECFQTYPNGIIDNEFHHTFIAELNTDFSNLIPEPNEVEALQLMDIDQCITELTHSNASNYFVETNQSYYLKVWMAINDELKSKTK